MGNCGSYKDGKSTFCDRQDSVIILSSWANLLGLTNRNDSNIQHDPSADRESLRDTNESAVNRCIREYRS